jgi:hypothetical protein
LGKTRKERGGFICAGRWHRAMLSVQRASFQALCGLLALERGVLPGRGGGGAFLGFQTGNRAAPFRGSHRVSRCRATGISPIRSTDRSAQMRIRTLVATLAIAAPLLALESRPAAAFGWCNWGWGSSGYGYSAPRGYGYYGYAPGTYGYYGYAPRYGGYYYGRRWGWRGYGYRGWRGYRGWHGARVASFRGTRVAGFRGGFRGRR